MKINCKNFSECNRNDGGCCAISDKSGSKLPSYGYCQICKVRDPINSDIKSPLLEEVKKIEPKPMPKCGKCQRKESSRQTQKKTEPYEVVIKCHQSPGDITLLHGAIREVQKAYPGKFRFSPDTHFNDLFYNSPWVINREHLKDPITIESGQCWSWANQRSDHLVQEFTRSLIGQLNDKLKLDLKVPYMTEFRGCLILSEEEKNRDVTDIIGEYDSYFLIDAGWKSNDYDVKRAPTETYQQVVDGLLGKVKFVQMGRNDPNAPDRHPPLKNVINAIGLTENRRDFLRLVYRSSGVITPISWPLHASAAIPMHSNPNKLRPCVVLAGGREPVSMIQYPGHSVLSMVGKLDCCLNGGCFKTSIGHKPNDMKGVSDERCLRPENGIAKCMRMITAPQIISAVESYLVPPEKPKICIASIATNDMRELRDLTFPNKKQYAEKHNYGFVGWEDVFHEKDKQDRPASWSKLPLILQLFSEYNWIFWSDADSVITNMDKKIEDFIDNDYDLIIAADRNGRNCGQFLIKSSQQSWDFLRRAWEQTEFINDGCWEQSAIGKLLRENPNQIREKIVPQNWFNSYPDIWNKNDFLLHAPRDDRWNRIDPLKNALNGEKI